MSKAPAGPEKSKRTESRKREHIETVLNEDVAAKGVTTGFERFFFEHQALPELSIDAVDLTTSLFGKSLRAPLLISSMTGGTAEAKDINLHLAEAAQSLGIAMGLGSQRAAIERDELADSYRVRQVAPDILLFANMGAVQLNYGYGLDQAKRAIGMIEADALFLHLNPLQEAVQAEGDRNWGGLLKKIEALVPGVGVPVVVKEVGNGISASVAQSLVQCGVAGIDVAGAGGTSWSEVEAHRQPDPAVRTVAHSFADWGIPTALALMEVHGAAPDLPVFASGGMRSGTDVAKAIRLGATLCGTAAPTLVSATETADAVRTRMTAYMEELRIAAFCTGSADLAALRRARLRRVDDWSVVTD
ncbi:MAG: type 2 isopentenyl-diphosphate Delta-isomerase [Rhodospirillaceae bacterium]|jgi:isopentenyl-diphosphate Delta-isomerase|nr:type 2 isopentenyl-diphosphate Delta-isomerase [Rhodospirillaceae bacterium]